MKALSTKQAWLLQVSWTWLGFILAIGMAWYLLASVDFGYAVWYEYAGIKENILRYAPHNEYKDGFALVPASIHLEVFHKIVQAIHQAAPEAVQTLTAITYPNLNSEVQALRSVEIQHLTDVAILISFLNKLLLVFFIIWLSIGFILLKSKRPFANLKQVNRYLLGGLLALGLLILLIGPTKVFYQFHIWVFPAGHQWFFYYEDSLMSTMMKAPDLFAFIGLSLVASSLIVFLTLHWLWFKVPKLKILRY